MKAKPPLNDGDRYKLTLRLSQDELDLLWLRAEAYHNGVLTKALRQLIRELAEDRSISEETLRALEATKALVLEAWDNVNEASDTIDRHIEKELNK